MLHVIWTAESSEVVCDEWVERTVKNGFRYHR
jgi:hypothetical protein